MTKNHIEFVLSGYGVPFTDALANKLLEMFDEEAASYQYTINELNKALSENKSKWIPVSERLPEESTWVLVTCKNPDGYIFLDIKLINRYSKMWDGDEDFIGTVLAWMPLPKPYKAESEVENEV